MKLDEETFSQIVESIKIDLKKGIELDKENKNNPKSGRVDFFSEESVKIREREYELRRSLNADSEVTIPTIEYWHKSVKGKIEIVAILGGPQLITEMYHRLQKDPDNTIYNYSGHFISQADGIANWYA